MVTSQWALQVWRFQLRKHITNTKSFIVDKMIHNYVTHYNRKTLETLTYTETLKSFAISLAKSKFFRFLSQQMKSALIWIAYHVGLRPLLKKSVCGPINLLGGLQTKFLRLIYIPTILLSHACPIPAGKVPSVPAALSHNSPSYLPAVSWLTHQSTGPGRTDFLLLT